MKRNDFVSIIWRLPSAARRGVAVMLTETIENQGGETLKKNEDLSVRGSRSGQGGSRPRIAVSNANLRAPVPTQPESPDQPASPTAEPFGPQRVVEKQSGWRRRTRVIALGTVLLALVVGGGYVYFNHAQRFQSTDDAFIASRQIAIAPKVSGYIKDVLVTDNQHVARGDVIAQLDDRDFRVALEQANAQVAAAQASIESFAAQITVQQAQIVASEAQLDQAQAALVFAQQQAERYNELAKTAAGSLQNAQQYTSQLAQQQAAVRSAQAALDVAKRQIDQLKAQLANAQANLAQAVAQRDQAELNLSYTNVTAAQAGRVVNLTASAGEFAQAGTNLTMFVPDEIWVTANFKETQLDAMRPGQPVTLNIDAYPERKVIGRVASVQPGSGTAFSLLPAQNATGNYVKVVQRVPVKIVIENVPADIALGPGMSVVPSVRVNPKPSLYERLAALI
jgi:membrane fusion protein, multidrug efflux system